MHTSGRYFYRDIQNFPDQLDHPHFWYSTPHILRYDRGFFVGNGGRNFCQMGIWLVLPVWLSHGIWAFWGCDVAQKWHPKDSGCWITDFRVFSLGLCSVKARKPTFYCCDLCPLYEILFLLKLKSLGITLYPYSPTREVLSTDDNQMLKEENSRISNKYLFIVGLDRRNANNSSYWHSLKLIHLWSVTSS